MEFRITPKEETMQTVKQALAIREVGDSLAAELAGIDSRGKHLSPEKVTGSFINYRDKSNIDLQDLCEDIDFDFDTLDGECIDRLQSMECDTDRIQWLEIVRREREEGA